MLRPQAGIARGQLLMSVCSLLVAGVLLARGFIGLVPGRPLYLLAGLLLVVSALAGLTVDHVRLRSRPEAPEEVLAGEVDRCRRYGRSLCLVVMEVERPVAERVILMIRQSDRAWWDRGRLTVLLVESGRDAGLGLGHRIAHLVPRDRVRLGAFPGDAITLSGLLAGLSAPPAEGGAGDPMAEQPASCEIEASS